MIQYKISFLISQFHGEKVVVIRIHILNFIVKALKGDGVSKCVVMMSPPIVRTCWIEVWVVLGKKGP